jgi:origin recognition complex subunit 5
MQTPRLIYEDGLPEPDSEDEEGDNQYTDAQHMEDSAWVWQRYIVAIWESLAKSAARDIVSFKRVADKLWTSFVKPIIDGDYGTRDFSKLMVARRSLFQGEEALIERIVDIPNASESGALTLRKVSHDLPLYSKYLLCAAYLASYNPARLDPTFFMKAHASKRKRRGGGGGTPGRPSKHRKISRTLLGPAAFTLERLTAIFHALLPYSIAPTLDIQTQIATLASLRLLVKTSASADVMDAATKWRVNVSWEYIRAMARGVGLEVADYLADG